MAIKLFISDLDGTLLKESHTHGGTEEDLNWSEKVSWENLNAVDKLKENNIMFGIATGRMLGQVEHVNWQLGNICSNIVTQNGNYIYDKNYKLLIENVFNVRENLKIIKYIREFGFKPVFLDKETIYIDLRYINYNHIISLKEIYKNNYIQMLNWNNPWEIAHSKIRPGMVSIDVTRLSENQKIDLCEVIQEDLEYTQVTISSPFVIDIFPKETSKFNAIKLLAKIHNIQLDEIAFIGDSGNDVSVFKELKNSYCMDHARKDVKKYAPKIVQSVAEAIEDVIKNI